MDTVIGVVIGAVVVACFIVVWYVYHLHKKREERPSLLILNPVDRTISYAGKFKGVNRTIRIPVSNSEEKVFWAVETDHYVILPAYGRYEDLMIEDERRVPIIKIMMAEVIGSTSKNPGEAVREWSSYAFDTSLYDLPPELDLSSVPPNYIFVRPIYKREWGEAIHRKGLAAVRHIFGEVARMRAEYDREEEILHENYGRLLSSSVQSANEMIMSVYHNALEMWDTVSEQRVLPWEVMGRLLHQPMDELNFTGLQQAIQSGNIRELGSQIIGSYRKALDSMAGEFGLTTMSQPMAEALMKSLNNMQNKLAQSVKREYAARQANMQQLSDRARQGGSAQGATSHKMAPAGQSGRREHERPVIEMYEE
jgi:hypothetical protein